MLNKKWFIFKGVLNQNFNFEKQDNRSSHCASKYSSFLDNIFESNNLINHQKTPNLPSSNNFENFVNIDKKNVNTNILNAKLSSNSVNKGIFFIIILYVYLDYFNKFITFRFFIKFNFNKNRN